jgi:hypothetical protein
MLPAAAAVAGAALAAGDAGGAAFSRSVRDEGPMALKLSFMSWLSNAPADAKPRAVAGAGAAGARVAARGAAESERGSRKLG